MTVAASSSTSAPPFQPPRRFDNGAQWLRELGDVPPERIIFDPWPGTATEADLLRLVERDKRLCELIDGTLVEKPVGYWEGIIAVNLARHLANYAQPRNLGLVSGPDSTLRMKGGRVRLPDVAFVSMARAPKTRAPIPDLSPDLAVEILTEANTKKEMDQKLREYFASGTRLVWIINPATRTATVYRSPDSPALLLEENGVLDGEQVLPGFTLAVAALFHGVPRA